MIFHRRTDWERPPRFTWCTLLGSSSSRRCYKKLDLKQSPPTLLAGCVGYVDGFLGSSAKEKAKAGHESATVVHNAFQMTKRQLVGFTVTVVMFLAFVFAHWLAPIFGYSFPQKCTIGGCILFALAWGVYSQTDFARKN